MENQENQQSIAIGRVEKVGQEQVQDLIFSDKLSWQAIIYDLINSEQLDPWDIDLSLLTNRYLNKIRQLEEANFFVSSKVLLAASLLLRLKSEVLLNHYIPSLDDILFGKKEEEKKYTYERIELDEDIPDLIPKSPLPRARKVTLQELMASLGKAINTETRRIRKVVLEKQYEIEAAVALPRQRINIRDRIKEIYSRLREIFSEREHRLSLSEFAGNTTEEKIATFVPLLHLHNQDKVWLDQENHFEEIWILLKSIYNKQNAAELQRMREEVEEELRMLEDKEIDDEQRSRVKEIEENFDNPLGEENF